jgi:signal transduction histidine kinase
MTAPQPPLYVEARRGALMHAMFNLLDNAARSNRAGATVSVNVENRGPWVVVDITDTGPGIPPDVARARGPIRSSRGSGLGLMAARRFVEDCGGHLSLTALDAHGTRCRVELPRIRSTLGLESAGAR